MNSVVYTADAAQDLEEIYRYIAEDNILAAQEHRRRLTHRCNALVDHPRMGRKRDDIKPGVRSIAEGEYVVFYRVVNNTKIVVLRVIHGMRDLSQIRLGD